MVRKYKDGKKRSYCLRNELGRGGEGSVYEVSGRSDIVAKLYNDEKLRDRNLEEKLKVMIRMNFPSVVNNILTVAWPLEMLYDSAGRFAGYTMPKVMAKNKIFAAAREYERKQLFPNYDLKVAIKIAYNFATVMTFLHDRGIIVGDLNSNNIMLDSNGHITLIDCDSFQISSRHPCSVGVFEILPPELQGKDLRKNGNGFTEKTDDFSLAIYIFELLFNNCHPFGANGLNISKNSKSLGPIEHNIVTGNCVYVGSGKGTIPLSAPDFDYIPAYIQKLFMRAFKYNSSNAIKKSTIENRPPAKEWKAALLRMMNEPVKVCGHEKTHLYFDHRRECPWCAIDGRRKNKSHGKLPASTAHRMNYSSRVKNNTHPRLQLGTTCSNQNRNNGLQQRSVTPPITNQVAKKRSASFLYIYSILLGILVAPLLAKYAAVPMLSSFTLSFSNTFVIGAMVVLGIISGVICAVLFSDGYENDDSCWCYFLLSTFLTPIFAITGVLVIILLVIAGMAGLLFLGLADS